MSMVEFFKGWRRKAGVLTLLIACGMCCLWMRSFRLVDIVAFGKHRSANSIRSNQGTIGWHRDIVNIFYGDRQEGSNRIEYKHLVRWHQMSFPRYDVHRKSEIQFSGESVAQFQIPYWSIVMPLTLLSAYLLIVRPKESMESQMNQPEKKAIIP